MNHPVIPCYVSESGVSLVFYCPHCKTMHSHGAGGGEGHRVSHCHSEGGRVAYQHGYILRIDPQGHEAWMHLHKPPRRRTPAYAGRLVMA
jgi:hypothetical protein